MLLNNIVVLVAVGLQSFAVHPAMFILGRFVVGINSGQPINVPVLLLKHMGMRLLTMFTHLLTLTLTPTHMMYHSMT